MFTRCVSRVLLSIVISGSHAKASVSEFTCTYMYIICINVQAHVHTMAYVNVMFF